MWLTSMTEFYNTTQYKSAFSFAQDYRAFQKAGSDKKSSLRINKAYKNVEEMSEIVIN